MVGRYIVLFSILASILHAKKFPDLDGIKDFSRPKKISNTTFILTNPKSGSHLLLYSIMKISQSPLRGRLALELFYHKDHAFPENIMNYPLDFSKPTIYWGHEFFILSKLNRNQNKLIFIDRDYVENIASQIVLKYAVSSYEDIRSLFEKEILEEGVVFREFTRCASFRVQ